MTVPPGQGIFQPVAVNISGQLATGAVNSVNFSYSPPSISQVTVSGSKATHGAFYVTVTGQSFGLPQGAGNVTVAGSLCNVTSWAQSTIICLAPTGEGTAQNVIVTQNSGLSSTQSASATIDYDPPSITSIIAANTATGVYTSGGTLIVKGTNFGTHGYVIVGTKNATTLLRVSDTELQVQVPNGQGVNIPVTVNVAGRLSNSALFSYAAPIIQSISPANGPTIGNTSITLVGTSFGNEANAVNSAAVMLGGSTCTVTLHNDTHVICLTPAGQGIGVSLRLTVGGTQSSNLLSYSYDAPTVSSVTPATGSTDGGDRITITGLNFGTASSYAYATVAGGSCVTVTMNQTNIVCTIPVGEDVNKQIVVNVAGQSSPPYTGFSYSPPVISSISPVNGPTQGYTSLTVKGYNFGSSAFLGTYVHIYTCTHTHSHCCYCHCYFMVQDRIA
jgi:hypothetical protein